MCSDAYSFKEKEIFVIKNFVNKKLPLKIVKVEVFCCQYLNSANKKLPLKIVKVEVFCCQYLNSANIYILSVF